MHKYFLHHNNTKFSHINLPIMYSQNAISLYFTMLGNWVQGKIKATDTLSDSFKPTSFMCLAEIVCYLILLFIHNTLCTDYNKYVEYFF